MMLKRKSAFPALATLIAPIAIFLMAAAPAMGQTRIQGELVPRDEVPAGAGNSGALLDHRELIRGLVQNISSYAHSQRRNFMIIAKGSPELLTKVDDIDETKVSPARAYMKSIDGIMIDGLFFGARNIGQPTPPDRLDAILKLTDLAKRNRLNVMVMDYVDSAEQAGESYARNGERKYTSFAADARGDLLNAIPSFSNKPVNENPKSILSIPDVKNFLYMGDSSGYGRQDEFSLEMHRNNFDLIVVDVFHGRTPLTRQAVETLKYKGIGAKRLVFAHLDVGTAAAYHYYWQPGWREGSPHWINAPLRDDPDKFRVQYWNPEWQDIIYGNTNSYIYGLIAQGFDGVVLEGLEVYKYYIGGGVDDEEQQ
ncbi:MAG: hypothetical protein HQ504_11325 [Rhodospirillaceae bacterium]|nr:hypothetical protein [Rhodospirillaceae bacterium]